jgi:hypothetical protein
MNATPSGEACGDSASFSFAMIVPTRKPCSTLGDIDLIAVGLPYTRLHAERTSEDVWMVEENRLLSTLAMKRLGSVVTVVVLALATPSAQSLRERAKMNGGSALSDKGLEIRCGQATGLGVAI